VLIFGEGFALAFLAFFPCPLLFPSALRPVNRLHFSSDWSVVLALGLRLRQLSRMCQATGPGRHAHQPLDSRIGTPDTKAPARSDLAFTTAASASWWAATGLILETRIGGRQAGQERCSLGTCPEGRQPYRMTQALTSRAGTGWIDRNSPALLLPPPGDGGQKLRSACCLIPNCPGEPYLVTALRGKAADTARAPASARNYYRTGRRRSQLAGRMFQ